MTQEQRIIAVLAAIGGDVKALRLADGNLTALPTLAKDNLVAAIAEVFGMVSSGASIDDAAGDGIINKTWSANKIYDEIAAAALALKNELRAGAGGAFDTFAELAAIIAADESTAVALATAVSMRVRFDAAQGLTDPQKLQARINIGAVASVDIGNPDADLVAAYTAAKA